MRAERADFQGRDRQFQIIDRAGRRGEMKNVIDFFFRQENEVGNVVLDEPVILVPGQMPDVRVAARDEIVDCDDAMTFCQKPVGQMGPQKAGPTGDDGNGISFVRRHRIYLAADARICQQEVKGMTKRLPSERLGMAGE
jgi:hypothetical protein